MKRRKPFSGVADRAAALPRVLAASLTVLTASLTVPATPLTVLQHTARVTGIAQVTFYAKDLAASRVFYGKLLGYDEPAPGVFQVNGRQSVRLVREKEPASDRLVSIAFESDGPAVDTTDADGHHIQFA